MTDSESYREEELDLSHEAVADESEWAGFLQNVPDDLKQLVTWHRMRTSLHRAEKRLVLQLKGICRGRCRGDKKAGSDLYDKLERAYRKSEEKIVLDERGDMDLELMSLFSALFSVRVGRMEAEATFLCEADNLPIIRWADTIPGLDTLSLAQLIAECAPWIYKVRDGELSRRHQESRVWKRLGIGLIQLEGEAPQRQRKAKNKLLAKLMGYNPSRRSVLSVIGENLLMVGGRPANKATHRYYQMYLTRKEYERANHPELPDAHTHLRAKRYMEKKLVRHMLAEWNKAVCQAA